MWAVYIPCRALATRPVVGRTTHAGATLKGDGGPSASTEASTRGEIIAMTPEQEAFIARARARLRELEGLRAEARDTLTTDDYAEGDREIMLHLDAIHGAITRALRGQVASLHARPATRYTVYRLDIAGGRWFRVLTTRDMPTALRHLIDLQESGEISHLVPWETLADRAIREGDGSRFRPRLAIVDAGDQPAHT